MKMLSAMISRKAYLAIPIQGNRLSDTVYNDLSKTIKDLGFQVANPQVLAPPTKNAKAIFNPKDVYRENCSLLQASDLLIAEISSPSLGIGYEIAMAEHLELPIFCVYHDTVENPVSLMILGIAYSKIHFIEYQTIADLKIKLLNAIHNLRGD